MALSRQIKPDLSDSKFFDEMFGEMNKSIAHMHHDMRSAMHRITPQELVSEGGDKLNQQLDKLREPLITKEDGTKELCLQLDVGSFTPEEITIKTENGELHVEAKHEDKSDNSKVFHTFSRQFTLPKGVDLEKMTSSLSKDGVLVVRSPVNPPAIEEGT